MYTSKQFNACASLLPACLYLSSEIKMFCFLCLTLSAETEQPSSPSRTGFGSDHEDSQTANMGNVKDLDLRISACVQLGASISKF